MISILSVFVKIMTVFLTIWLLLTFGVVSYLLLAKLHVLTVQTATAYNLLTIDFYFALGLVGVGTLYICIAMLVQNKVILIILFGLFVVILLFGKILHLGPAGKYQKSVISSIKQTITTANNIVINFSYELFGLAEAKNMATDQEIFEEVNLYRTQNKLSILENDDALCQIGLETMGKYLQLVSTQIFLQTNRHPGQNSFVEVAEIVDFRDKPHTAKQIVEQSWALPLTKTREFLDDQSWQSGCSVVIGNSSVFLFARSR